MLIPRRVRGVLASVTLASGLASAPRGVLPEIAATARAADADCERGWRPAQTTEVVPQDVRALAAGSAVAAGMAGGLEARGMGSPWRDGASCRYVRGPAPVGEDGLLAVDGKHPGLVWAVGFDQRRRTSSPAARWALAGLAPTAPPAP